MLLKSIFLVGMVHSALSCGGTFTLNDGNLVETIESENYPSYYPRKSECEWIFSAESSTTFSVECSAFDLRTTNNCKRAKFIMTSSDGSSEKVCDGSTLSRQFTTDSLTIYFKSKQKKENTKFTGFSCQISIPSSGSSGGNTGGCGGGGGGGSGGGGGGSGGSTGVDGFGNECTCGLKNPTRIVGGQATQANEYPWQAMLKYKSNNFQFCGGSLIAKKWALSAAHCLFFSLNDVAVTLGEHDKTTGDSLSQDIDITRTIRHPSYSSSTYDNDIGLIELASEVTYNDVIAPVCLPFNLPDLSDNDPLTVTGWGTTSYGGSDSDVLMEVVVSYIVRSRCISDYGYGASDITNNMVCAAGTDKDSCQGDSGGPMSYETSSSVSFQIGVVSWGYGCAEASYPGVYAKVRNYLDWIKSTTQVPNEYCIV